jgi:C_GCAxxG_C_C family probable redox protein
MSDINLTKPDIIQRFDKKIIELKDTLPPMGKNIGNSCAADTLNGIVDILKLGEDKYHYFNNLAVPFSGFAHCKAKSGWKGPCGAISGAIAAMGIIIGGQEKIKDLEVPKVYGKAIKFAKRFEEEFGSVMCEELCGFDLNIDLKQYVKTRAWENKCCNFILFAIDNVCKLTKRELKQNWG